MFSASAGVIHVSASMSAVSSSSVMLTCSMYAALLIDVIFSLSSAALRRSAAVPHAIDEALWIMSIEGAYMTRSSPAMKITDAIEQAIPSHRVTILASWRLRAL